MSEAKLDDLASDDLVPEELAPAPLSKIVSLEDAPERARQAARPFDRRGRGRDADGLNDHEWGEQNLRCCDEGYLILDIANVLRILERHPQYQDRYFYDNDMHKVVDRGVVMVLWQLDALAGEIQERFLANINEELIHKAVYVVANKSALSARV